MRIDISKLTEEEKNLLSRSLRLFDQLHYDLQGSAAPPSPSNLKWFVLDHALECANEFKSRAPYPEMKSLIEKLEAMKQEGGEG